MTERIVPTLTHPTMEWKLNSDDESTATVKVNYSFAMPKAIEPPQDADAPHRWRHPYPNCFQLRIEEADRSAALATLSRPEAERLYRTLGDALAWDGQ